MAKYLFDVVTEAYDEEHRRGWPPAWEPVRRDPDGRAAAVAELRARRREWAELKLHEVHLAVITDDVALFEKLAKKLPDPLPPLEMNVRWREPTHGATLLELAAGAGSSRILDLLLDRGDPMGHAVRNAVAAERMDIVEKLVTRGTPDLVAALVAALDKRRRIPAEFILDRISLRDVSATQRHEVLAAVHGNIPLELLDRLIASGLDLEAVPPEGTSAVSLAYRVGLVNEDAPAVLAALAARGYRLTPDRIVTCLQRIDYTPRMKVALAVVDLALAQPFAEGVSIDDPVDATSDEERNPPETLLDVAIEQLPLSVVQRLLAAGARPSKRKLKKNWEDAQAKIAWFAAQSNAGGETAGPSEELLAALGPSPARKKTLVLSRPIESFDGESIECDGYVQTEPDLAGIEACKALQKLQADHVGLVDLSRVASLTKLVSLEIVSNEITDLRPLEKLTKLAELHLRGNRIVDASPLGKLTALTTLSLADNPVVDISALARCPQLEFLSLGGTLVTDLAPIAKLPALKTLVLTGARQLDVAAGTKAAAIIADLRNRGVEVYADDGVVPATSTKTTTKTTKKTTTTKRAPKSASPRAASR